MITDIFVPMLTYPDPSSVGGFSGLAKLVEPLATSITACAFVVEIPVVKPRLGGQILDLASMAQQIEADSQSRSQSLLASATSSKMVVTTRSTKVLLTSIGVVATRMARTHDCSLIALDTSSDEKVALAQSLIFGTGRPVILAPKAVGANWDVGTVAIAWDGSRSASRAVHDALPLIIKAERTVVITAFDDKVIGEGAVAELVAYLERHTVRVCHHDFSNAAKTRGSMLQFAAREQGAGILVMGAFGHSRLRDFILGGATQSILRDLKMPVFLSHQPSLANDGPLTGQWRGDTRPVEDRCNRQSLERPNFGAPSDRSN